MGRHPQSECIASDEHSKLIPRTRDIALSDLFAIAITRKTAPKREDTRLSSKSNTSVSERIKVDPEKPELHAVSSIRRNTEIEKPSSDHHSKQGKPPLYPTYQIVLPHRLRPPLPDPTQRLQDTSPSAHTPSPKTPNKESASPYPTNNQPLESPTSDLFHLFNALTHQLHTIRSSLNASKREYGKLKTHHHKALRVFCTGRCEGWAKEESKISRRFGSVSRALREDRKGEREVVDKVFFLRFGISTFVLHRC